MTRNSLRGTGLLAAFALVMQVTSGAADAKPKKKGGSQASPPPAADTGGQGGGMTFEPEEVHKDTAPSDSGGKKGKMKFTPEPARPTGPAGPPSKVLERALKLYDAEDYANSSIELNKVIEGQSGDDEANKQRGEFFMGKTLFNMKYYSASLSYFDKIVQKGPSHRYYQKTLQWLASLSRFLPESAGVLEKIGKYTKADLDQPALDPVKDELYYLLGRFHYQKGNFKEAIDLFNSVPEKSEFYPKAKFLEGLTHVREYHGKIAADSFKAILRKVKQYDDPDKVPKALKEAEELANLSLGRVFYSTKQYNQAIKYFEKLPGPDSREGAAPDWGASLFEASWAYFMVDGDSKALGNIHSIASPFFETEFYPEAYILKAVIYFNRCNYDRSQEAINEFNAVYPDLRKEVDAILSKYADNAQFFDYVLKIRSGEAGLSERASRAAEGALADRSLQKNIEWVSELDRELKAIDKSDPAWRSTAVAGNILQDLTLQKSLAANDAGQLARNRMQRLSSEIQDLTKQAIKIEYETLNGLKGSLTAGIAGDQATKVNPNAKNYNNIVIDDEHQQWPFTGEYWQDELGYYRFKVANKCGR
ncbi:MAG: Tetratricopeptide repeat protein [Myxococcales bacterium]|nr:Tetratricopeptide repeat protein [Myxococcales bacterium]